jgi:hypothetical protein
MLIPRFSLRSLLIATAVCAVFSLVIAGAVRGQPWAVGMTAGFAALLAVMLLHPLAFGLAAILASLRVKAMPPPAGTSPFATSGPPRQIIPPSPPPE